MLAIKHIIKAQKELGTIKQLQNIKRTNQ